MRVRDVMSSNVQSCSNQDALSSVASKMQSSNIGALPVVENNQVVGMITDRDMVVRGLTSGNANSNVSSVMSNHVISVSPDASLEEAASIMSQNQIRRLPVIENGSLVGMVSLGDLSVRQQADQSAGQALSHISEKEC
ncbi:CBS domain-containing protein [Metabacillus iocasae]|uniref:CBS domain-containing protein n=1 Tax=Priestia iocasae TaxID=2291674 RepID=A0ABS2QUP5_9BACI|nr:CBS domain-containing protein [Metabacillus iocasae]MBM7703157.1 CBS domain-containing protein [Metabacillus iocasae]